MRKISYSYLCIWLLFLLSACNQEGFTDTGIICSDDNYSNIVIKFSTKEAEGRTSSLNDTYKSVNEVRILLFCCDKAAYNAGTTTAFRYVSRNASEEIVPCKEENGIWTARGKYTPSADQLYRIYAFAYDKTTFAGNTFNLTTTDVNGEVIGKRFYFGEDTEVGTNSEMSDFATIKISPKFQSPLTYYPTEFFVGPVVDPLSTNSHYKERDILEGVGSRNLTGVLYRATGRFDIQLTGIDASKYSKMRLIMDKYTDVSVIGCGDWWFSRNNPDIKIPSFRDVYGVFWYNGQSMAIVDEADVQADGTIALVADGIPAQGFSMYVEPFDKSGKGMGRFLVMCKDKEYYPGYTGILDNIVQDGKFTMFSNYWGSLAGPFKNLGNVKIELDWENDYVSDEPLIKN